MQELIKEHIREIESLMENWIWMSALDVDKLLDYQYELERIIIGMEEQNDISKIMLDNDRWKNGLLMKAEMITDDVWKSKLKYTDKTLEFALDLKYEQEELERIGKKYEIKLARSVLIACENKINLWKKVLDIK